MEERMKDLVEKLNELAYNYYVLDNPTVSDKEYDEMFDELLELENKTGIILDNSPTKRVGGEPIKEFVPHTHIARLWSLDKVRTYEALKEWADRAERIRLEHIRNTGENIPPIEYSLEYKFDGLTINLTYDNGKLVQAASRGNGVTGEGILEQIKTIHSIPLTIDFKGKMEVQGEGYMRFSVLDKLNKKGEEQLKNARNAAAGALRNLDPMVTAKRRLDCCCYNVGYIEGEKLRNIREMVNFLRNNNLPTSDFIEFYKNIDDVSRAIELAGERRDNLDFPIDGMVVKISDFRLREIMGNTERFPRWAIAFKFAAEETTTTIIDITWEVGRTGKLTPRAHVEPVELAGATIRHATLNNFDDIVRKKVGIGARVFLRRSNDVIPEILGSVDGEEGIPVEKPKKCPACGAHVENRGVHIYCTNSLSCKPQIVGRLSHFASRNAMDIDTFSDKTAEQLIEALNINDIPSIYMLDREKLISLDRFGEKKADKLLDAIEKSKDCSLGAFLFAIGIPNVGEKTAKDIAKKFKTIEKVRRASYDELVSINDVGDIVARSIVDFFEDESIVAQIDRLLQLGVKPREVENNNEGNILSGKTIVVTGTLEKMGRSEIEKLIEDLGGKASGSVSKKTSFVVAGAKAGSKLDKANALGITVISEKEFYEMIEAK